jgi:MFS family permease
MVYISALYSEWGRSNRPPALLPKRSFGGFSSTYAVNDDRLQFYALYLSRFAGSFGFVTLVTLLPKYIEVLDPTAVTLLGITLSAGVVIGMFTTGFTLASTVAIVPMAWFGDRYDKRLVLLAALGLGIVVYALFPLVNSSLAFIGVRALQGLVMTGAGLMSLALVGELAAEGTRANAIGKANAARFAAGIGGSVSAGFLYDAYGFGVVFGVIVGVLTVATLLAWRYIPPDRTTVYGFPFTDLALNERILTITSFRAQYAVAVTLVRTWVPIYAGVSAAKGGLGYEAALAVSLVVVAEKLTNMICQPFTGRISDTRGRALFVFVGGGFYGLVALAVPFAPAVGGALGLPATFPVVGDLSAAFIPLLFLNGLLGVADSIREPASMALFADQGTEDGGVASSFGVRNLVWRPGNIAAPLLGGWLMADVGMQWVFYVGGAFALTGIVSMLAMGTYFHGPSALTEW